MARLRSVVRSKDHEEMVQKLSRQSVDGKQTVFRTIRELLCFAAMLGFQMGKKAPLAENVRGEDVMIEEFERNESVDLIYLIAVADTGGTEILKSDSDIDSQKYELSLLRRWTASALQTKFPSSSTARESSSPPMRSTPG